MAEQQGIRWGELIAGAAMAAGVVLVGVALYHGMDMGNWFAGKPELAGATTAATTGAETTVAAAPGKETFFEYLGKKMSELGTFWEQVIEGKQSLSPVALGILGASVTGAAYAASEHYKDERANARDRDFYANLSERVGAPMPHAQMLQLAAAHSVCQARQQLQTPEIMPAGRGLPIT